MFLYLHGFASGPHSAKATFFRERLAEAGIDLVVPELDGGDFEHLTITNQLQIIRGLAVGSEVTLIGSSMGGYLASLFAANHPVQRLLLLAPAFGFTERWPSTLGTQTVSDWQSSGWLSLYHYGQKRRARLGYELIEDAGRYEPFPKFAQPALIIHGQDDDVVPVSYSRRYAAENSNVRLEVVPGGHEMTGALPEIWRLSRSFLLEAHV